MNNRREPLIVNRIATKLYEMSLILKLLFKSNKTEEEKIIVLSYKVSMLCKFLIIIICCCISFWIFNYMEGVPKKSDAVYCMFNGNYTQCNGQQILTSELDRFGYEIKKGEFILLFFDEQNNLINVIPDEVHNNMVNKFILGKILMFLLVVCVTICTLIYVNRTVGYDYLRFKRGIYYKNKKQKIYENKY